MGRGEYREISRKNRKNRHICCYGHQEQQKEEKEVLKCSRNWQTSFASLTCASACCSRWLCWRFTASVHTFPLRASTPPSWPMLSRPRVEACWAFMICSAAVTCAS